MKINCLTPQFLNHQKNASAVIKNVKNWHEDQQKANCKNQLLYLVQLKNDLINSFINPNLWPALYLSDPALQEYLNWVLTIKHNEDHVMVLMRELATAVDVGLAMSEEIKCITEKIYTLQSSNVYLQHTDFLNLHKIFENSCNVLLEAQGKNCTEQRYIITVYIEQVIEQFCNHLKKTKQLYELLFLYTLLYPFDYDLKRKKFWQLFTFSDMKHFKCKFENQCIVFFQIKKEEHLELQAYLFSLTFSLLDEDKSPCLFEKTQMHVNFLKHELEVKLKPEISNILEIAYEYNDWTNAGLRMQFLYKNFQLKVEDLKNSGGQKLEDILQSKDDQHNLVVSKALESASKKVDIDATYSPEQLENNCKCNLIKILEKLGLLSKFPKKLTTKDALLIRLDTLGSIKQTDQMCILPYLVLQKIMLCDSRSRMCLYINQQPIKSTSKIKEINIEYQSLHIDDANDDESDDDSDDDNEDYSTSSDSDDENECNISPIDVILAVLHCSDDFLRQDLLRKLSLCQFAIPCFLPDHLSQPTFLLMGMRSIIKAWKSLNNGNVSYKEYRIIDYQSPFITFIKVGDPKVSKSAILNIVIDDPNSKQDFFFNWNCDGGNYKRLIADGVIDICWYLPSGNREDFYEDALTFLNLHGNALQHYKQLEFIKQVSSMLFVLIGPEKVDKTVINTLKTFSLKILGGLTILFCKKKDAEKTVPKLKKHRVQCNTLILENNNPATIRNEIRNNITEKLKGKKHLISLSECDKICRELEINVDEDNVYCSFSKELAQNTVKTITEKSPIEAKSILLPLQGPSLWHQWAHHDKEQNRHIVRYKTSIEHYNSLKQGEKLKIRKEQSQFSKNLSPLISEFLKNMLNWEPKFRKYYLEWVKMLLDDYSRAILPELHNEYQQIRNLLLELKGTFSDSNAEIKQLKYRLRRQNEYLAYASFGIEHFFREIGQIYEAKIENPSENNLTEKLHLLPQIVAQLVNDGYAIEIMDGDASHVPIRWVCAVLGQMKILHEGKKLLVISVLGIQSSGKSTLLNTMFGLQFNVSAGRCTRGVFLQLVPVDDLLQHKLGCDLIVIIDTEGLRAPELQSDVTQAHDNELATFVIGLADVTIINIFGETPGDLDDILQTTVHAFIRMKKMTFHPKCHFVHQNVSDISASDKSKVGRQTFLDNLDKITEAAAKIENCEGQFQSFKSVIAFHEEKDVHFFPALWNGDPPMAPVNRGYSEQAQRLKSAMVSQVSEITKADGSVILCTFVEFEQRLTHLWNSVLQENFIFSFKNSLEIVAYDELDANLNQWTWKFQDKMRAWQIKTENKINSVSDPKSLESKSKECLNEGKDISKDTYQSVMLELKNFFEHNEHAVTLAHWRGRTEERILQLQTEFDDSACKICTNFKLRRQDTLQVVEWEANKRKILKDHIEKLVTESKKVGKELSDEELKDRFEKKWKEWKDKLSSNEKEHFITPEDIYSKAEKALKTLFKSQHKIMISMLNKTPLKNRVLTSSFTIDDKKHLTSVRWFTHFRQNDGIQLEDIFKAEEKTKQFLDNVKKSLLDISKECQNFSEILISDPLKNLQLSIKKFNMIKQYFTFTDVYIAEIAIHVCVFVVKHCIKMMEDYQEKNDPLISLERHKVTFQTTFLNQCKEVSSDKTAADTFCQLLIGPIKNQMYKAFPEKIKSEMKQDNVYFKSKKSLKCSLLETLAEEDDFEKFRTFLDNAEESYKWYIKWYIEQHYDEVISKTEDAKNTKTKEGENKEVEAAQHSKAEDAKIGNTEDTENKEIKDTKPSIPEGTKKTETKLMELAKQSIEEILQVIKTAITQTPDNTIMKSWLENFHKNLDGAIELTLSELIQMIEITKLSSCEFFCAEIKSGLSKEKLMKDLDLSDLKEKSYAKATNMLYEFLSGCTEQCPFCHEYCEMSVCNHLRISGSRFHSINVHRPQCLAKFRNLFTGKLVIDICTTLVGSECRFHKDKISGVPYKNYQKYFPKWNIQHDVREVPDYWKWFVGKYNKEIANWCSAQPGDIPPEWCAITKDQAKKSLRKTYDL